MQSLVFKITGNICVDYNDDFRSGDSLSKFRSKLRDQISFSKEMVDE